MDGSNAGPIGQEGTHRGQDLGRLVEPAQELVDVHLAGLPKVLPAPVDEQQAGTAGSKGGRRLRRHDCPEPVAREHDPIFGLDQQLRPFGDRDCVTGQGRQAVVGSRIVGRRIGQPVPPQVHRNGPARTPQAPRHGRPDPRGLRQAVDQQRAGPFGQAFRPAPIQEVDAVAAVDQDDKPLGFRSRIRGRDRSERQLHRR